MKFYIKIIVLALLCINKDIFINAMESSFLIPAQKENSECKQLQENPIKEQKLLELAQYGNFADINLALITGAEVNTQNSSGYTALHVAAAVGYIQLFFGPTINNLPYDSNDAMRSPCATADKYFEIASLLISNGADINIQEDGGLTPLHIAAAIGDINIVTLLLNNGADINLQDNDGETALHAAVLFKSIETASLLISRGADINLQNSTNETSLDLAKKYGRGMTTIFLPLEYKQCCSVS